MIETVLRISYFQADNTIYFAVGWGIMLGCWLTTFLNPPEQGLVEKYDEAQLDL